jgi:tRNA threonylcarbamoyladenosine biosynthesis protein TsaB
MNTMKLLALDTATEACSAALYIDGDIQQKYQLAPREHTKLILIMIEELLADAGIRLNQLNALAFGRGPGSFTGVRIATGVVQGLAFGADLPVVSVSTLASIAQAAYEDHGCKKVLAAIDARMGGVYWGEYQLDEKGLMLLKGNEAVLSPAEVPIPEGNDWVGAGSGWLGHSDALQNRLGNSIMDQWDDYCPQSKTITLLAVSYYQQGLAVEAKNAMPVYLRNDVAKKSQKKQS